jgi:hypothetical protein
VRNVDNVYLVVAVVGGEDARGAMLVTRTPQLLQPQVPRMALYVAATSGRTPLKPPRHMLDACRNASGRLCDVAPFPSHNASGQTRRGYLHTQFLNHGFHNCSLVGALFAQPMVYCDRHQRLEVFLGQCG